MFSQQLEKLATEVDFGPYLKLHSLKNAKQQELINQAGLSNDFRAKAEARAGYASVFEGLDFDPQRLRSQAFYLNTEDNQPIMVAYFLIAPQDYIKQQRYLEKVENGVYIRDIKITTNGQWPEYLIIPGWIKLINEFENEDLNQKISNLSERILRHIAHQAPGNSWLQLGTIGYLPWQQRQTIQKWITEKQVDEFVSAEKLPFDFKLIGKPKPDISTIDTKLKELKLIPNVAEQYSLGPVYGVETKLL